MANEQASGSAGIFVGDEWSLMGNGSIASRLLAALVGSGEMMSGVGTGRAKG